MDDINWLRIDERKDVLISLEECLRKLDATKSEPEQWKWAIIALHSAISSAMVCHLTGTANVGALRKDCAKKFTEWRERDRRGDIEWVDAGTNRFGMPRRKPAQVSDCAPERRLADAKELFKRLSNEARRIEGAGPVLTINDNQKEAFSKLHGLRNEFIHFEPASWSIVLNGLPRAFKGVLDVIAMISLEPWAFRHMDDDEKERLCVVIQRLRSALDR